MAEIEPSLQGADKQLNKMFEQDILQSINSEEHRKAFDAIEVYSFARERSIAGHQLGKEYNKYKMLAKIDKELKEYK